MLPMLVRMLLTLVGSGWTVGRNAPFNWLVNEEECSLRLGGEECPLRLGVRCSGGGGGGMPSFIGWSVGKNAYFIGDHAPFGGKNALN